MSSALTIASTPEDVHATADPAVSQARTFAYEPPIDRRIAWRRFLPFVGLVWDLMPVPSHILFEGRRSDAKAASEETLVALPFGGDQP